ncbi:MAG: ATP synthase F0 subunit C [bacterium]|nr:ATP synthase F0 subunit C [bacterium]
MDAETIRLLATAIAIGLGIAGPALAVGMIGASALKGISRNPEATPKIQTNMILAIAFAEALGIYVLVIALIIKFVK